MKHNKMNISKTKLNLSVIREITLFVLMITIVIILPQAGRS